MRLEERERKRRAWGAIYGGLILVAIGVLFLAGFKIEYMLIVFGALLILNGLVRWFTGVGEVEEVEER